MFEWIQQAFTNVLNAIQSAFDFVKDLSLDIYNILKYIPSIVAQIWDAVTYLPSFVQVFAIITVTVLVIFLVINRQNGSS